MPSCSPSLKGDLVLLEPLPANPRSLLTNLRRRLVRFVSSKFHTVGGTTVEIGVYIPIRARGRMHAWLELFDAGEASSDPDGSVNPVPDTPCSFIDEGRPEGRVVGEPKYASGHLL